MTAVIEHTYVPRGTAQRLMECRDPEVLLSGPAGTGKSRACLEKLHFLALLNPGMRGLIVRKTLVSLTSTGLVTYQEHVAAESIAAGHVRYFGGSGKEPAAFKYSNGSTLVVGGMDNPTKIMSSEYDVIYVQEAIELTEDDWEKCTTRLRNGRLTFQQLMADTNPDTATHWLNVRGQDGRTTVLESRHEDNPVYFDDHGTMTPAGRAYIEGVLDKLTGVRYLRLRKGLWVAAEGVIYEDWDTSVHLVDRFDIPEDWDRWWIVDFGFKHAFVCQWWAEDPDGRLFMYRELQYTKRLVETHAATILQAVTRLVGPSTARENPSGEDILEEIDAGVREWTEPVPRELICDHDAEGRATLELHLGMSTTPALKTVTEGIQAAQSRLLDAGDGRRRLYVLRDSLIERDPDLAKRKKPTCLAEEIPGYRWDEKKEQPVKEDDDGCDCLRYIVAARDLGAQPRVRFLD